MKSKFMLVLMLIIINMIVFGQRPTMELTVTALNNEAHVQLDSIKVMNRTQGGDTVLYWPDTVLAIYFVSIPDLLSGEYTFRVFPNYPNPATDQTNISLYIPEKDKVSIIVTDILGRMSIQSEMGLDRGKHTFRFTPGMGNLYFFTARWKGQSNSIKILHTEYQAGGTPVLEYTGCENNFPELKSKTDNQSFFFSPGDELLYIGYSDTLESGMLDSPEESATYTLQFATNISCPGTPTVDYEGQVYNTIQIFSQCWLKENLNVGEMIQGTIEQSDNGNIEKFCYQNNPDSCTKYGGLYQWNEMMQYTSQQGTQGICPPGWHLPTDEEWKVLEGAVDSQYEIGDYVWDSEMERGYDAGTNLRTSSGWNLDGNGTDLYGFSALPAGIRDFESSFGLVGYSEYLWTSTTYDADEAYIRRLTFYFPQSERFGNFTKNYGLSIRCLMD